MNTNRIKDLRFEQAWTQKYISEKLGINRRTYSGYENGNRTIPPEILVKLAGIYHVSVDYLLGVTDERRPYKKSYITE